jgi:membrane protein
MDFVFKFLARFKIYRLLVNLTKLIRLPGFEGLHLYEVAKFFYKGIKNGAITTRASALAFTFFLALFPAIIFFFTMIAYLPIKGFQDQLLQLIKDVLPDDAYKLAYNTIFDILKRQHGGLLSIGFFSSIYLSTNGINSLISSFNKSHHYVETRKPVQQYIVSLILVFTFAMMVIISITLIIFTKNMLDDLVPYGLIKKPSIVLLIKIGQWIIISALFFLVISFLYYVGPANKNNWRFVSAGSTLATLLSLLATILFSYYVNKFAHYNKVYGSIGTLIVIMLWLYFNSMILLIGFELNASIDNAKKRRVKG